MFLTTIYLISREVLEVSFIACLLFVYTRFLGFQLRYFSVAVGVGLLGALLYVFNIGVISGWWFSKGQEILLALLVVSMYTLILWLLWIGSSGRFRRFYYCVSGGVLTLSLTKELSEIILFLHPVMQMYSLLTVSLGAVLGVGIGLSGAVILYFLLMHFSRSAMTCTLLILLSLFAAGLLSQGVALLAQAGLIPSSAALWNSEWLISESSILGQMLFSLFSYESTPSVIQCVTYGLGVIACLAGVKFVTNRKTGALTGSN